MRHRPQPSGERLLPTRRLHHRRVPSRRQWCIRLRPWPTRRRWCARHRPLPMPRPLPPSAGHTCMRRHPRHRGDHTRVTDFLIDFIDIRELVARIAPAIRAQPLPPDRLHRRVGALTGSSRYRGARSSSVAIIPIAAVIYVRQQRNKRSVFGEAALVGGLFHFPIRARVFMTRSMPDLEALARTQEIASLTAGGPLT
jgi:hypothetical protein